MKKKSDLITLKIPQEMLAFCIELFDKLGLEIQEEKIKKPRNKSVATTEQLSFLAKRMKKNGKTTAENLNDLLNQLNK